MFCTLYNELRADNKREFWFHNLSVSVCVTSWNQISQACSDTKRALIARGYHRGQGSHHLQFGGFVPGSENHSPRTSTHSVSRNLLFYVTECSEVTGGHWLDSDPKEPSSWCIQGIQSTHKYFREIFQSQGDLEEVRNCSFCVWNICMLFLSIA